MLTGYSKHALDLPDLRNNEDGHKKSVLVSLYLILHRGLKHMKASNLEHVVQLSSELIVGPCLVPL